jgi:hypothetical protein
MLTSKKMLDAINIPFNNKKDQDNKSKFLSVLKRDIYYLVGESLRGTEFDRLNESSLIYDEIRIERLEQEYIVSSNSNVFFGDIIYIMHSEDDSIAMTMYESLSKLAIQQMKTYTKGAFYILFVQIDRDKIKQLINLKLKRQESSQLQSVEKDKYMSNRSKDLFSLNLFTLSKRKIAELVMQLKAKDGTAKIAEELVIGDVILDQSKYMFVKVIDILKYDSESIVFVVKPEKLFISIDRDTMTYSLKRSKLYTFIVENTLNFDFSLGDVEKKYVSKLLKSEVEYTKSEKVDMLLDIFNNMIGQDIGIVKSSMVIQFDEAVNKIDEDIKSKSEQKRLPINRILTGQYEYQKEDFIYRDKSGYLVDLSKYLIKKHDNISVPEELEEKFEQLIDAYNQRIEKLSLLIKKEIDNKNYEEVQSKLYAIKRYTQEDIFSFIESLGKSETYKIKEGYRVVTSRVAMKLINDKIDDLDEY